jgi:hypothetical protein
LAKKAEEQAKAQAMSSLCTVRMVEKELIPADPSAGRYEDKLSVTFELSNKGPKALAGVKGTLELYDMFGEKIKDLHLSYDVGLDAGETKLWAGTIRHNQALPEDQRLAGAVLDKMTSRWVPEMMVLEDGRRVGVAEVD